MVKGVYIKSPLKTLTRSYKNETRIKLT